MWHNVRLKRRVRDKTQSLFAHSLLTKRSVWNTLLAAGERIQYIFYYLTDKLGCGASLVWKVVSETNARAYLHIPYLIVVNMDPVSYAVFALD